MTKIFKRILKLKKKSGLTWAEIAELAGIPLKSWMTGLPTTEPTDEELKKLAPVFGVTYKYLKYGK